MSGIVGPSFTMLCLTKAWLEKGISSSNYFPPLILSFEAFEILQTRLRNTEVV